MLTKSEVGVRFIEIVKNLQIVDVQIVSKDKTAKLNKLMRNITHTSVEKVAFFTFELPENLSHLDDVSIYHLRVIDSPFIYFFYKPEREYVTGTRILEGYYN